ncbi:Hypothetical_protein [Hexamita inflata]|uniref:Hypothetical_protein n=1 Tax=Hexamita inflata TaxID=28002 RepID=A0ABP1I7E1_9EUKA
MKVIEQTIEQELLQQRSNKMILQQFNLLREALFNINIHYSSFPFYSLSHNIFETQILFDYWPIPFPQFLLQSFLPSCFTINLRISKQSKAAIIKLKPMRGTIILTAYTQASICGSRSISATINPSYCSNLLQKISQLSSDYSLLKHLTNFSYAYEQVSVGFIEHESVIRSMN